MVHNIEKAVPLRMAKRMTAGLQYLTHCENTEANMRAKEAAGLG